MEKTQQFTPAQRTALAEMIRNEWQGLQQKAGRKYEATRNSLRESLIREFAEKRGYMPLIAKVQESRDELEAAESDLSRVGIELETTGRLVVRHDAPDFLSNAIEKELDSKLGTKNEVLKRFDLATIKVLTAATAAEAEKIVSELL